MSESGASELTRADEIRLFLLTHIPDHPRDIARIAATHFGVSRQTVNRHLRILVEKGLVRAKGKTRAREYSLAILRVEGFHYPTSAKLEEDRVWRDDVLPMVLAEPFGEPTRNVLQICQYGFTEMFNNAIEHSRATMIDANVGHDALNIYLTVQDDGVGIFEKIQRELSLDDSRHALLELSKGKLTTDPAHHSGEGIYFTSRAFDTFGIWSGGLYFRRFSTGSQWLIEVEDREYRQGTLVEMEISRMQTRGLEEVFEQGASVDAEYEFSRTHVPIKLVRYGEEHLVSRSQARRLLARFDRFQEVMLDFEGVNTIGQAFADEIFRVFRSANPGIEIQVAHATPAVQRVIRRAVAGEAAQERLFRG